MIGPKAVIKSATKMDYTPLVVRLAGFSVFFVDRFKWKSSQELNTRFNKQTD